MNSTNKVNKNGCANKKGIDKNNNCAGSEFFGYTRGGGGITDSVPL